MHESVDGIQAESGLSLSQTQRIQIAQHLEERLDPHVFRVDEKTILVTERSPRGVQVSYTLLEYGGCAGPGKTHQEQVFVESTVFA